MQTPSIPFPSRPSLIFDYSDLLPLLHAPMSAALSAPPQCYWNRASSSPTSLEAPGREKHSLFQPHAPAPSLMEIHARVGFSQHPSAMSQQPPLQKQIKLGSPSFPVQSEAVHNVGFICRGCQESRKADLDRTRCVNMQLANAFTLCGGRKYVSKKKISIIFLCMCVGVALGIESRGILPLSCISSTYLLF